MGWMHPITRSCARRWRTTNISPNSSASCCAQSRAGARPSGRRSSATSSSTPRSSGSTCIENGEAVDSMRRGGRQARLSDADDDRLYALRQPQPLLVRAARPRGGADRPQHPSSAACATSTILAIRCCPTRDENAQIIDPKTIDWKAVTAGKAEVLIRQLPGPHNSMGRMKFMFPNEAGHLPPR